MMMIIITVVIIVIDDRHHQALDCKDGDLVIIFIIDYHHIQMLLLIDITIDYHRNQIIGNIITDDVEELMTRMMINQALDRKDGDLAIMILLGGEEEDDNDD